jgi:hypothetical protein
MPRNGHEVFIRDFTSSRNVVNQGTRVGSYPLGTMGHAYVYRYNVYIYTICIYIYIHTICIWVNLYWFTNLKQCYFGMKPLANPDSSEVTVRSLTFNQIYVTSRLELLKILLSHRIILVAWEVSLLWTITIPNKLGSVSPYIHKSTRVFSMAQVGLTSHLISITCELGFSHVQSKKTLKLWWTSCEAEAKRKTSRRVRNWTCSRCNFTTSSTLRNVVFTVFLTPWQAQNACNYNNYSVFWILPVFP